MQGHGERGWGSRGVGCMGLTGATGLDWLYPLVMVEGLGLKEAGCLYLAGGFRASRKSPKSSTFSQNISIGPPTTGHAPPWLCNSTVRGQETAPSQRTQGQPIYTEITSVRKATFQNNGVGSQGDYNTVGLLLSVAVLIEGMGVGGGWENGGSLRTRPMVPATML